MNPLFTVLGEGPSPLPPVAPRLINEARAPQVGVNAGILLPTIATDLMPESTLSQWVKSNLDEDGRVKLGSLASFPGLPEFTSRRQRLDYRRELSKIWRYAEETYASGVAIDGLATVLGTLRTQNIELMPPKKPKATPYTPRHQR